MKSRFLLGACWFGLLAFVIARTALAQMPVCYWASDPVGPGEAALLYGEDFDGVTAIKFWRVEDKDFGKSEATRTVEQPPVVPENAVSVEHQQKSRNSLKFIIPKEVAPGVFGVQLMAGDKATQPILLNRADVWWLQGDSGTNASPGGWIRAFGKCLRVGAGRPRITLESQRKGLFGPERFLLDADGDGFALRAELPRNMPEGDYRAYVFTGAGGPIGRSRPQAIRILKPEQWNVFAPTAGAAWPALRPAVPAVPWGKNTGSA